MTKLKLSSALLSLALMTAPAFAQDFVEVKIQELFAQGYNHFEVSRGLFRTQIEAYGPNYTKLELQLSNSDGAVVRERAEVLSETVYTHDVQVLMQAQTTIREQHRQDYNDAFETDHDGDRGEFHTEYRSSDRANHDAADTRHDHIELVDSRGDDSNHESFKGGSHDLFKNSYEDNDYTYEDRSDRVDDSNERDRARGHDDDNHDDDHGEDDD